MTQTDLYSGITQICTRVIQGGTAVTVPGVSMEEEMAVPTEHGEWALPIIKYNGRLLILRLGYKHGLLPGVAPGIADLIEGESAATQ